MKVILQKDIPNLGDAGDIKDVADGYARNYLLPRNLVLLASEGKTKAFEHQERLIKLKKEKRKKASEQIADKIKDIELTIKAKVGEEEKLFGIEKLNIPRSDIPAVTHVDYAVVGDLTPSVLLL